MTPVSTERPRPVYGVDFSAAERDAGGKTWITTGTVVDGGIEIRSVEPLVEFSSLPSAARSEALRALADWIRGLDEAAVVGLDVPFGLPAFLVEAAGYGSWRGFITDFPGSLVGDADGDATDPVRAFAERCVALTDEYGEGTYDKRRTDAAVGARSPYGFIADTITCYGMRDVLAPIVDDVRVAPMDTAGDIKRNALEWQPDAPAGPTLVETYPAAVFDALGLCRTKYKGASDAETTRRRRNAEGLAATGELTYKSGERLLDRIVANGGGDALDSVAACLGAFGALESGYAVTGDSVDPEAVAVEGYIYALRGR